MPNCVLPLRRRNQRFTPVVAASAIALALFATVAPPVSARSDAPASEGSETFVPTSPLGSYLAGKVARGLNDTAAAAGLFERALSDDPDNPVILEQTFLMAASEGDYAAATTLAGRLADKQEAHRLAQLWLGVAAFREQRFGDADTHFGRSASGPIAELTSVLARAWTKHAEGNSRGAVNLLKGRGLADWAQFYSDYHRALILDVSGRDKESVAAFRSVIQKDPRQPRMAMAYASAAAAAGQTRRAITVLERQIARTGGVGHPTSRDLLERIRKGEKVERIIATPQDGLAEVLYGLGEALSTEGGATPIGLVYLQLALALKPDMPPALAALANVYESIKAYDRANATYDRIASGSPLDGPIEIRKALNLNSLERLDEARSILTTRLQQDPTDIVATEALANMLRTRKLYDEAIEYYSRVIDAIATPEERHWTYFYARGTCYERTKQWARAEADLQRALELNPNQPLVLNYLGYSWVDQNQNLDEGLKLIKQAVSLKPDDGYIVDSLGWAYYRLGNLPMAVKYLERAVELRPEDPILNDHLGDALWRVGRQREARFQWQLSLGFKPEPEDAAKIQAKIARGLPEREGTRKAEIGATAGETAVTSPVR